MYSKKFVKKTLSDLALRKLTTQEAYKALKDLGYRDLGFAKLDNHRALRRGFPEVVYCHKKTRSQIEEILGAIIKGKEPVLLTFATRSLYEYLKDDFKGLEYNEAAQMIFTKRRKKQTKKGRVLVVTGGTSDLPVAEAARITLELMGNKVTTLFDVGVAGLHRLLDKMKLLKSANVIIVASGMEGALASVVSGLVSVPVIAVPTSVGYGASFKGIAPLLSMLNCCSPGVGVVNIDNGFGAGYLAGLINK